jgi:murein DD-endopeptidase MepM/ murein hydrolase activator NlpD
MSPSLEPSEDPETPTPRPPRQVWLDLTRYGLREPILRITSHLAVLAVVALGVWAARLGLDRLPPDTFSAAESPAQAAGPTPTAIQLLSIDDLPGFAAGGAVAEGIVRLADAHTVFPSRPRLDVIQYTVQAGDTVFGVAENFGLHPETLLWGNYDVLKDDPHNLQPGQQLTILPVDGTSYVWNAGDSLSRVAEFFGVEAQDVIDWPGNDLSPDIDLSNPPIASGTLLVIPGGHREFVTWSAPRITRANPAVARIFGPGACGSIYDGPVGTGVFIWPTNLHYLSGYDYSPATNHMGIDIAGDEGHPIYASDNGVVVYSGWNDHGYGNVIVLDHGNGWQTLYAHLSQINMVCGQAVFQGNVIGLMGSTGNSSGAHLHFEMRSDEYGFVNPWLFLP